MFFLEELLVENVIENSDISKKYFLIDITNNECMDQIA